MKNILLTISYDGTDFAGWQWQPQEKVKTVQREVEKTLSKICDTEIKIFGTGRTDSGVHAIGQRANFSGDFSIPTENIVKAANSLLPDTIAIMKAEEVPLDFHARYSCKGKTYEYKVNNSKIRNPLTERYAYHIENELDINKMREAAKIFEGTHDFKAFQAAGGNPEKTTTRNVSEIEIIQNYDSDFEYDNMANKKTMLLNGKEQHFRDSEIMIRITGNGFLYKMVRKIVGTLVDVGNGKKSIDKVAEILESKDRSLARHTAPAHGLYLKEIFF
ncbi:MAG: tRNA pseudouridine(38-40) synthase TruA [Anaerovoracaceae bacterium]